MWCWSLHSVPCRMVTSPSSKMLYGASVCLFCESMLRSVGRIQVRRLEYVWVV